MANLSEFSLKKTLNCKGRLLELDQPVVMGILNVTPDSFYDGGQHHTTDHAVQHAERMLGEGATMIDVGGYSTRPGAADVSETDELQRVIPVIERIAAEFPQAFISVDTFRARVAEEAVQAGAHMINDISGGDDDPNMFATVAKLNVPYILMHKQGSIATMQQQPHYEDVVRDIVTIFQRKTQALQQLGVADIILDPGFGFGKTIDHNFEILRRLHEFGVFQLPVLAGLSRKSSIYKTLGTTAEHALNGTTVCHTIALLNGASILRAHDVREAVECIQLTQRIYV
jgi:dihydropteroate synthase